VKTDGVQQHKVRYRGEKVNVKPLPSFIFY
jgi:hypothetical protein